jgi:hypothetical protein
MKNIHTNIKLGIIVLLFPLMAAIEDKQLGLGILIILFLYLIYSLYTQ